VQWTVLVVGHDSLERVKGKTLNMSARGFYAVLPGRLNEGTETHVRIFMISPTQASQPITPCLDVLATVVRVEPMEDGTFGTAFSFEDYSISRVGSPASTIC
jgi:hypothetical protein